MYPEFLRNAQSHSSPHWNFLHDDDESFGTELILNASASSSIFLAPSISPSLDRGNRLYHRSWFSGVFVDTGAQRSVSVRAQTTAYCTCNGTSLKLRLSFVTFRFGEYQLPSKGTFPIRVPIGGINSPFSESTRSMPIVPVLLAPTSRSEMGYISTTSRRGNFLYREL